MSAFFGPAGNSQRFYDDGNKSTWQMMAYLENMGLNAYEYQCGRGVSVSDETAKKVAEECVKHNIKISVHAPYFISLSSVEESKRQGSIRYILQSAELVKKLGGDRIVVHSGSCGKLSREVALEYAKETVKSAIEALKAEGLSDVHMCLETMGKVNQLGNLDEVMALCELDDWLLPTIDFGHLNARDRGSIKTKEDYAYILDTLENRLGSDRAKVFHAHFSKIEYTDGGEKKHLTFEDDVFGPEFMPLAELIAERDLSPTIICESAGTQTEDALAMMNMYKKCLR